MMRTWVAVLSWAAVVLFSSMAYAGEVATTLTEVLASSSADANAKLCGYYSEGGKILQLKQLGSQVKGYISSGSTRCLGPGELYFEGHRTGRKVKGQMTVCNPQICVKAGHMPPTRKTVFRFSVFQGGKQLIGYWVYDSISYKKKGGAVTSCWDSGQERKADFQATKTSDDCASLKQALADKQKLLSFYEQVSVDSDGAIVDSRGQEVAPDFNTYQDMVAQEASKPSAGGSGVTGEIDFWKIEEVLAGNQAGHDSLCWCETQCSKDTVVDCEESWAMDECEAHEAAHCSTVVDFCNKYLAGKPRAQATRAYQSFTGNPANHIADEIAAYEVSIAVIEQKMKELGCE